MYMAYSTYMVHNFYCKNVHQQRTSDTHAGVVSRFGAFTFFGTSLVYIGTLYHQPGVGAGGGTCMARVHTTSRLLSLSTYLSARRKSLHRLYIDPQDTTESELLARIVC